MDTDVSESFIMPRMDELRVHVGREGHIVISSGEGDRARSSEVIIIVNRLQVDDLITAIERVKKDSEEAYSSFVETQMDGIYRIPGSSDLEIYITEAETIAIKQTDWDAQGSEPMILVHPRQVELLCGHLKKARAGLGSLMNEIKG